MRALTVPVRELKARLSYYLGRVQAGQIVEVTAHRKPVARLTPVPPRSTGVDRMVASGMATWSGGKPTGARFRLSEGGPSMADLVISDRS